jgi:transmembrane protein 222
MPSSNQHDLSFCILWSPLPPITWFLPFIGHTGIADSRGIANDFQGSYYVGTSGRMAFGAPTRYLKIDVGDLPGGVERWDDAIREANQVYNSRMHNICCDNCHSHVCNALNRMPLNSKVHGIAIAKWDMVKLCFLIFVRGRFISWSGVLAQFLPMTIMIAIFVLVKIL